LDKNHSIVFYYTLVSANICYIGESHSILDFAESLEEDTLPKTKHRRIYNFGLSLWINSRVC